MRRLLLELGVLAALLVSLLTVPLALPHVATGTVWVALTSVHVARRRRIYAAFLHSVFSSARPTAARRQRRLAASTLLIGCTAVVALSGFAQWAGVAAAIPWHAGSSTLLIVLAATHASRRLWRMRRRRAPVRHDLRAPLDGQPDPQVIGCSASLLGGGHRLALVPVPDDLTLTQHTSAEAARLMDELYEVYADAYGAVPGEDIAEKSSASGSGQARRCTREVSAHPTASEQVYRAFAGGAAVAGVWPAPRAAADNPGE